MADTQQVFDDSFVDDAPPPPEVEAIPAEAAPEVPQEEEAPEASPAETGDVDTPTELSSHEKGLRDAMVAERKRRQKVEEELAYYRGLAEGRQTTKAPDEPEEPEEGLDDDFWTDPAKAIDARAEAKAEAKIQKLREEEWNRRVAWSREKAAEKYKDLDEVLATLDEMAKEDPTIATKVGAAYDPVEFGYKLVKAREAQKAAPEENASLKARIAELEAKLAGKSSADETAAIAASAPKSLANSRSLGEQPTTPLEDDDILDAATPLAAKYR